MQRVRRVVLVGTAVALCAVALGAGTAGVAAGQTGSADANVSVEYYVAPASDLSTLRSADTAADYDDATLTRLPFALKGSPLVVRLRGPDLADAVAAAPGDSRTERLLSLLDSDRASLRTRQDLSGGVPPGTVPATLALTDPDAVTAVGVDEDTVDLVVDTSQVTATRDLNGNGLADDDRPAYAFDDAYRVNFSYAGATNQTRLVFGRPNVTVGPTGEPLRLVPLPNQTVTLRPLFVPGSEYTVDVIGVGERPFRRTTTLRITRRNLYHPVATLDLTGVPDGGPVSVVVRQDGEIVAARDGRVVAYDATLSAPDRVAVGRSLVLRNVSLSHAGFVVARAGGPDGRVVAIESLDAGDYPSVTLDVRDAGADRLAVLAYVDLNGNGVFDRSGPDRATDWADPVLATVERVPPANVSTPTPATETATRTATPVPSTARTATATDAGESGTFTSYTVTDTSGPGFGVPVALLAAVCCALALLGARG